MEEVYVSVPNKCLLVPRTGAVESLFPSSPVLNGGKVLPHNLVNYNLLRRNGIKVPHPMLVHYAWPGPVDQPPFKIQKATACMMTANARAYNLNGIGTGKTRCALWAWDYLRTVGEAGKLLVLAPLSTLYFTWKSEIFTTLPHRKAVVLHGTKKQRLEQLNDPEADIFLINHDGIKVIFDDLHQCGYINTLVVDELAKFRNNSQRTKSLRLLAAPMKYVWGMTGSPMPNAPTDVWQQCRILTPASVPKYFSHARDMLMRKIDQWKYVAKPDAIEKAYSMMQPAVRFTLDDVAELPDAVERTQDVPISDKAKGIYTKLANEFQVMVEDQRITAVNAAAAMSKLLQVTCGWVYAANKEVVEVDAEPRLKALVDTLEGAQRKVIVFVTFKHAIDGISAHLTKNAIDHAVVHGGINHREVIFNAFQNTDSPRVLLAHPECMAHGVTLTTADTIIWWNPTLSYETYEQANGRIRRVGQKHKQLFLHFSSTPVERKLYAGLQRKELNQNKLLALFKEATAKAVGG